MCRFARIAGLVLATIFAFSSCEVPVHRRSDFAMSTTLTVVVSSPREPRWQELFAFADDKAWQFDHRRKDGALGMLNESGAGVVPEELLAVLQTARTVASASGGAFDPTILPLTELWSFDSGGRLPDRQQVERAKSRVDYSGIAIGGEGRVVLPEGFGLDLGAIAKGAVVDLLADYLEEQGYEQYLIDAGGDILVSGLKQGKTPWRVAIRHPRDSQAILGVMNLGGADTRIAVVTSGDYERYFEEDGRRYHHILDPRSGYPAAGLVSVTVLAPTCSLADALSTAVFVLGPEAGLELLGRFPGSEGLLITEREGQLSAWRTAGFPGEMEDLHFDAQ